MYKGKEAREHERTYLASGSFRLEGGVASKLTKRVLTLANWILFMYKK